jgi:HemY protein
MIMRIWAFILVFALAVAFGVMIHQDPGYALFAYKDWTVEMPLWLAVVFLVLIIILSIAFLSVTNVLFSSSSRLRGWWLRHKQISARRNTARWLLELAEGRWKKAEKRLSSSAAHSDVPLINYLSAATAAEESGAVDRRDRYLQLAHGHAKGKEIAVRLTQAQLQHKHGDIEQSLSTLQLLYAENPNHPQVLKQLAAIYESIQDWDSLLALLPSFYKAKIFPNEEARSAMEQKIYLALLPEIARQGKKELTKFWKHAPNSVTGHLNCQKRYIELLHQQGGEEEAESLLRTWLKKNCQDPLLLLYGTIKGPSPKKQLAFAEELLKSQPNNPVLFLTLGRLSLSNQLWGKARDYLEQNIRLAPSAEAYALIAELMDRLGQPEKRDEYFRKGLLFVTQKK